MLVQRPSRTEEPVATAAVETEVAPALATPLPTDVATRAPEVVPELPRRSPRERIDVRIAMGIGIAWFVLPAIAVALEPEARHADPSYAVVLGYALDGLFVAMLVGLAMRRRWGLVLSLAAAMVTTAFAVACPTSGHHQFGLWWLGEMACVLALVAGSVWALRQPAIGDAPRS